MGKADLHTHTDASDGDYTPEELTLKAKKKGLEIFSITDHDTIKGYLKAKPVAKENEIKLMAGVEFTAAWKDREVHILAYCFDENNTEFLQLLIRQKKARKDRMKKIVSHLQKQGVDIEYDEVVAEARGGNIGRPHAASVLISKGLVASVGEAFIRYLSSERLKDIKTEYAALDEIIRIVRAASGVTSLAHPGRLYSSEDLEELVSFGIDGLECIHPSHNFTVQRNYAKMAKDRGLLVTGGSDFHGKGKPDYDPYFGIVTLGEQHVQSVIRLGKRRKEFIKT